MNEEMLELNHKLDVLQEQMAFLTQQAQRAECARVERDELMHDLTPIASQAMNLATEQLQEIEDYVRLEDLLRIVKKIARHMPEIENLLDQVDSVTGLLEVVGPIGKGAYDAAERVLQHAEDRGYFAFGRGGLRILANIVTSFSEEDVQRLGDNIVLILRTIQQMTQPEVMNFLSRTATLTALTSDEPLDISYGSLLKQMRDPQTRRGLALALRVLHGVGEVAQPNGPMGN